MMSKPGDNSQNKVEESNSSNSSQGPKRRKPMKPRLDACNYFTKLINEVGETKAYCNHCQHEYAASLFTNGTSTLNNHMKTCIKNPYNTLSNGTKLTRNSSIF